MSVPQIVENDHSPRRQKFPDPRVPPNLFAIALGAAGLAVAWEAAAPLLGTPQAVPDALDVLDAALWLVLVGVAWIAFRTVVLAVRGQVFPAWPAVPPPSAGTFAAKGRNHVES
jgi:hypothetical protein